MIPRRLFWFADLLVLMVAFLLAYWLMPGVEALFTPDGMLHSTWLEDVLMTGAWSGQPQPLIDTLWIFCGLSPATLIVLWVTGSHHSLRHLSRTRIVINSIVAPLAGLSTVTLTLFAFKSFEGSRVLAFTFVITSAVGLSLYRLVIRHYFHLRERAGFYAKNVLLVGQQSAVSWMVQYFAKSVSQTQYRLLGHLDVGENGSVLPSPDVQVEVSYGGAKATKVPMLGRVDQLGDLLIRCPIHEVIAVQPMRSGQWIEGVIRDCDHMTVLLRIVPEALLREQHTLKTLYHFATLNLPAVVLTPPHWDSDSLFVKRLIDIVVSSTLLVLLSPLFLAVAIAIKLTTPKLPIFYRWRVVGQNGVEFTGYKFTTMVADADERKSDLIERNEMSGPVFKIQDDPRVTGLGSVLRKYSINELPQLWSVLKGDMSLVGPRPAFRHELQRYEFWHKRKLSIQPGITCLWQVNGRNKISNFDDWVAMDLEYIDNWSLWLDIKILIRTAKTVVAGSGW